MKQLFDLEHGELFSFRYDRNTIYRVEAATNYEMTAVRVASKLNGTDWSFVSASHIEDANMYADVIPLRVSFDVAED